MLSPVPRRYRYGFNPCYVGLWSVSSCFHSDMPLFISFQSLLCWIMVCKSRKGQNDAVGILVSILVMLDYGL